MSAPGKAAAERLVEDGCYRVRYQLHDQRKPRELVGTYLGSGLLGGQHFDCRPAAGTTTVPTDALLEVELVRGDTPRSAPRVVPS